MRQWFRKVVMLVLALAMFAPLISIPTQANLQQMQQYRQDLRDSIQATRNQLAQTERYLDEAGRELAALEYQLMYVLDMIIILLHDLDIVQARFEQAIEELDAARLYYTTQEAIVHERLRDLHEHGQLNILDVLVQSRSVRDFMQRMEFMMRVSRQDQDMLIRLEQAEMRYEESVEDVARQRNMLEATMNELSRTVEELELLEAQWQDRHDELTADRITFEEFLAAYQAQERSISELIAAEERRIEAERIAEQLRQQARARANLQGPLTWPTPGFYQITSGFGMRPNPFNRRVQQMHNGIDIAERGINGTPVVAALGGVVSTAATGWNGGFGTVIFIDHGNNMTTVYAHLSRLQVSVGQMVHAGQVIGNVGSTGNSTGPHLHFEVRHGTQRVDPLPYLRDPISLR